MLSINPVKSVSHAKQYFMGEQNYYSADGTDKSMWWGKGAESLNLAGEVKKNEFENLLKGALPDGQQLGVVVDNKVKHRPGFDLTFSVPKSVSILALRSDDSSIYDSIIQATLKAVEKTLGLVEQSCAQARITQDGNTTYVNTKNLVAALHCHELSREDEASLHVHAVVMNMTQRSDGAWRSLASKSGYYGKNATTEINGFFERVGHQKKQLGAIFRGELAYELKEKGFPIVITNQKQGYFEIEGISQAFMDAHSTRSQQKNAYLAEHGLKGGNASAVAIKQTRRAKSKKSKEVLNQEWATKEKAKDVDAREELNAVLHTIKTGESHRIVSQSHPASKDQAKLAVSYAIDLLSETQIKIKPIQLINAAMKTTLGQQVNIESIVTAIDEMRHAGMLVPLERNKSEMTYTTQALLKSEQAILKATSEKVLEKDKMAPLITKSFLENKEGLTDEQLNAIQMIFNSDHRITALEGKSNTGKSTLIKPMVELAKKQGYDSIILTPTTVGSLALKEEIQKAPTRIQHFFNQLLDRNQYTSVSGFIHAEMRHINADTEHYVKRMIFVDNAQLLSLKQMHDLIQVSEKTNARLVPLFDKRAILSWQSGNPLQLMQDDGMKTATLSQCIKESRNHTIQEAVKDTLDGNIQAAFQKIDNRMVEVEDKALRNKTIASLYIRSVYENQKSTQVIMTSRAQCDDVNDAIHRALKQEQHIGGESRYLPLLIPKSMKTAEYRLAEHYKVGQWVRFNATYRSLNVERGDYLKICSIDKKSNSVMLENMTQDVVQWNPLKLAGSSLKVEVFDEKIREMVKGETLIWGRNNKNYGLSSGEQLKIISTSPSTWMLERENKKKVSIDVRQLENRHFDYGYALTPNRALFKKADTVIAYQNAHSRQSHQRLFYKVLSNATTDAWIVTEKREALLNTLRLCTGDKVTVIDTLLKEDKPLIAVATTQKVHIANLEKSVSHIISKLIASEIPQDKTPDMLSKEAVRFALSHLGEREAAFTHREIMDVAIKQVLGDANSDHILKAVILAEKEGTLVKGAYASSGTRWTTRAAIELEREIIHLAKCDQGKLPALVESSQVDQYLTTLSLKKDHQNAIIEWMKTPDRIVMVQGNAGTGKTTLLQRVEPLLTSVPLLDRAGYTLLCLAPTHNVVDELKSRGLQAQTLDSFIAKYHAERIQQSTQKHDNKLIIAVDENSMVSNKKERDFLAITHEIGARAVLIGDQRQYTSIDSGNPHTLLQSIGLKTIHLTDIVRQKNPVLIKGVDEIYKKEFKKAFETLKEHMVEWGQTSIGGLKGLDNANDRLDKMGQDYLSLSQSERASTGVMTLGNEQRIYLNSVIREGLKQEGALTGTAFDGRILVSSNMTKTQQSQISYFNRDDIIRFGFNDPHLGVRKGDYLSVVEIHKKENLIRLSRQDGGEVIWRPQELDKKAYSGIEVYRAERREIMKGDLLRWTRSDKTIGLVNPNMARVESITDAIALLQPVKMNEMALISDGKTFEVQLHDPKYQHWDYAHVMTSYGAQGRGFKNVMCNMESYSRSLTNQAAFLIAVTRSIDNLTIYTDNRQALLSKILLTTGTKSSALDTIGEVDLKKESKRTFKYSNRNDLTSRQGMIEQTKETNEKNAQHAKKASVSKNHHTQAVYLDANRIISALHLQAESIVTSLLGEPKLRSGTNYQYSYSEQFGGEDGKREGGSLSIAIQGDKQGLWTCFKTGEKGNLIGLIQKKYNMDFKQSLEYAATLVGLTDATVPLSQAVTSFKKSEPVDKSNPKNWSENEKHRVSIARKLSRESVPIQGTLGEKYLREHRGIVGALPSDIRFHPAVSAGKDMPTYPAVLALARNENGQVQRVQATYLDEATACKADLKIKKRTYALAPGSSVNLSRNIKNRQVTYLTEGVETGLSIQQSIDNGNVEVVLGQSNFKHPCLKNMAKHVVLCLDNDGTNVNPAQEKMVHQAALSLINQGKTVWIAKPGEHGQDYNDLLKTQGTKAVKLNIDHAIPYADYVEKKSISPVALKDELAHKDLKSNVLPQDKSSVIKKYTPIFTDYKVNERALTHHLSSKIIEDFASKLNGQSQNNTQQAALYASLNNTISQPKEADKTIHKHKDIEREI